MPRLFSLAFNLKRFSKRFFLSLGLLTAAANLAAQEAEEIPIILHSGSGKIADERQIHFSGGSGSDVVKNHQRPRLPPQVLHQAPSIHNGQAVQRIYRCVHHGQEVYADDENRVKYRNCVKISERRAENHPSTEALPTQANSSACSGAVIYQGKTYLFNEHEPCPIPDAIFQQRRPLEALPDHNLNQMSQP